MNIGGFYATVGDPEKALELNNRALKIQKNEIGDTEGQVNSLKNIGSIYHEQLDDNDKALDYLVDRSELQIEWAKATTQQIRCSP